MAQLVFAWFGAAAFACSLAYFLFVYLFRFGPLPSGPSTGGSPLIPLLINLLLFSGFAFHHSLFARTPAKNLVRALASPSLERATYTLVASVLFFATCRLWRAVPGVVWTLESGWRWVGYGAQVAGFVLTVASARALDVWELAGVRQASSGPPQPAVLKTHGLYGFVRHPLYFAWVLLVFGAPEMSLTRFSFAVISTAYLALAIPFEERGLIETFGPDYASYRKKVRWRMLPGIY